MSQTLINTLRFADRLKEAGLAGAQAEALARVLGDDLTERLPFADFIALQADFKALAAKFNVLETKFDGLRFILNIVLAPVGLLVALGLIEPLSKLLGS